MNVSDQQKKLRLSVLDYNLRKMWGSHPLIDRLRERVKHFLPQGIYDSQDLEHQILFRLTTFDPKDITDEIIQLIVDEQYTIVQDRLSKLGFDVDYLFRGLTGKYHDLNINDRLELVINDGKIVARNSHRSFNVEFRIVHDEHIVSLFSNELHYIHRDRPKGETFGFYFSGDTLPWAIETTEPSIISKKYKRDALVAQGIDPNKAVELTRFYTLPGAPTNAISLMDGLVSKYYKAKGVEALFTTTMPMYSKTKSTTIAGGINKPLLVKDLRHKFIPEKINGKICYRHVTTIPEDRDETEVIKTHHNFPTMFVVEVYKTINNTSCGPISLLDDGKKVIYVKQRDNFLEKESKFPVADISEMMPNLRGVAVLKSTECIRDIIWGSKSNHRKIRMRITDNLEFQSIEVIYKHRVDTKNGIRTEVEEMIYRGPSKNEAIEAIKNQGDFLEENSYEKTRINFETKKTKITLDIYPYGVWVEIEGETEEIWKVAKRLGYKKADAITENADELYLAWAKNKNLPVQWDVRFGLTGKK